MKQKPCINKIITFPDETRESIDKLIMQGVGSRQILAYLKSNHPKIKISQPTVDKYIKIFKTGTDSHSLTEIAEIEEKDLAVIQKEVEDVDMVYATDKPAYIDTLIYKVNQKLIMLDRHDRIWGRLDLRKESVYKGYIELAMKLSESKAKLEGELQGDNNIVVNILNSSMGNMTKIVFDTAKQVCPEKLLEFKEVFKKKFSETNKQELLKGE